MTRCVDALGFLSSRRALWLVGVVASLAANPVYAAAAAGSTPQDAQMGVVPWANLGNAQTFMQLIQQFVSMAMQGGGGGGGGGGGSSASTQSMIDAANAYNSQYTTAADSAVADQSTASTATTTTSTYADSSSASSGSSSSSGAYTIDYGTNNTSTASSGSSSSSSSAAASSGLVASSSSGGGQVSSIGGYNSGSRSTGVGSIGGGGGGGGSSSGGWGYSGGKGVSSFSTGANNYQRSSTASVRGSQYGSGGGAVSGFGGRGMRIGGGDPGGGRYLGGEMMADSGARYSEIMTGAGGDDPSATDPSATLSKGTAFREASKSAGDPRRQQMANGDTRQARKQRYQRGYDDAIKGVEPATDEPVYRRGYDDALNHQQVVGDTGVSPAVSATVPAAPAALATPVKAAAKASSKKEK